MNVRKGHWSLVNAMRDHTWQMAPGINALNDGVTVIRAQYPTKQSTMDLECASTLEKTSVVANKHLTFY